MWLTHHVSENLILSQGCSHKYNNNKHIHVDNNKIKTLKFMRENGITVISEDGKDIHAHLSNGTATCINKWSLSYLSTPLAYLSHH